MTIKVLIANAKGEEAFAEKLAKPIQAAGYQVVHEGTILVGNSVIGEASRLLDEGAPVVVCGTVRAAGTNLVEQVVNAARSKTGVRVFVVQMEEEARLERLAFGEVIARHWQDSAKAEQDLVNALLKSHPLQGDRGEHLRCQDLESRYRHLALKSSDIIDLANLPVRDYSLVTRDLELRRLYVTLRMQKASRKVLEALEQGRASAWGSGFAKPPEGNEPVSLGERLSAVRSLVVLGDPGAGKTTLLRWLATAYLLRLQQDSDWQDLLDVAALPDTQWLPILVRCRDLPSGTANLDEMLHHSLRKMEFAEQDCKAMTALLRAKLETGEALLLVDGLDEITDPKARAGFAQQLEQVHRALPEAPMVVTSRIVGYREMGRRIRGGFEHLAIADLSREDKDEFVRRWCELTEPTERREATLKELCWDIHSSDRIERLTGNPMLLTSMVLIKRNIGRLPQRRLELYENTVDVLLNWRRNVGPTLDRREALPQLEYLAYAMCDRGVQQMREDEVLGLMRRMRQEYPQIRTLKARSPEKFLDLLERCSGLLVQSGHIRHDGTIVPVYEFRHLTFQEYLAGIALVQGHFPGRDRTLSLAANLAPLAGRVAKWHTEDEIFSENIVVMETWREALRLCVAACNDDDVDKAILAILKPLAGEELTIPARAVLASLCLAYEPNVSDAVAQEVLRVLVTQVGDLDGSGNIITRVDAAAMELADSSWAKVLADLLLEEFFRRNADERMSFGGLCGMVLAKSAPNEDTTLPDWLAEQAKLLSNGTDERMAVAVALTVMDLSFHDKSCQVPGMVPGLIKRLSGSAPMSAAAAWALGWMNHPRHRKQAWRPSEEELASLIRVASNPHCDTGAIQCSASIFRRERNPKSVEALLTHLKRGSAKTRIEIIKALGAIRDAYAIDGLLARMEDRLEDADVKEEAANALGRIGSARAVDSLLARWDDEQEDTYVRRAAGQALGRIGEDRGIRGLFSGLANEKADIRLTAIATLARTCKNETERRLLSRRFDGVVPFLDPRDTITEKRVEEAAAKLNLPMRTVCGCYDGLANSFRLKLAWQH